MLSFIAPFYKQEWSGFNSAVTWNMTSGVRSHTEVLDKYCILCLPASFSPFTTILLSTYLSKPHKHTQKHICYVYIWRQITLSVSFLFICLKHTHTHTEWILSIFFFLSLLIYLKHRRIHIHTHIVYTHEGRYLYSTSILYSIPSAVTYFSSDTIPPHFVEQNYACKCFEPHCALLATCYDLHD